MKTDPVVVSWDVAPDGKGFLAIEYGNTGGRLQAVVNWFEGLRLSGLPARK